MDIIKSYKTRDGEIELSKHGALYTVAAWKDNGDCHWAKDFLDLEKAETEYTKFKHLQVNQE